MVELTSEYLTIFRLAEELIIIAVIYLINTKTFSKIRSRCLPQTTINQRKQLQYTVKLWKHIKEQNIFKISRTTLIRKGTISQDFYLCLLIIIRFHLAPVSYPKTISLRLRIHQNIAIRIWFCAVVHRAKSYFF